MERTIWYDYRNNLGSILQYQRYNKDHWIQFDSVCLPEKTRRSVFLDSKESTELTSESLSVKEMTVSISSVPEDGCKYCAESDCDWNDARDIIEKYVQIDINELQKHPSNIFQKKLYKVYITETYGLLGRGHRVQILECVLLGIRKCAPEIRDEN